MALRSQPIFELIKWQLESDLCRGIFTHLKSCHQMLVSCFNSEKIARKSRYIPLGVAASPSFQKAIDRKFQEMPRRKGLRVLFTNSAHSGVANFHLRGGAELLVAFGRLVKTFPDAKLTIVSTRPADESLRDYPMANVVWLDQGITDDRLYDLLLEADVFALPAAGLHSYSALRAMKFGAVLICSDAPGYDEYVVDNETGFVVSVKPKDVYQPDPETGWMRDDYSAGFKLSPPIAADLTRLLDMLARDSSERHRVALAARKQVDTRHALQPWVTGIADFLEEARQKPR